MQINRDNQATLAEYETKIEVALAEKKAHKARLKSRKRAAMDVAEGRRLQGILRPASQWVASKRRAVHGDHGPVAAEVKDQKLGNVDFETQVVDLLDTMMQAADQHIERLTKENDALFAEVAALKLRLPASERVAAVAS